MFESCFRVLVLPIKSKMPPKRKVLSIKDKIDLLQIYTKGKYTVRCLADRFKIGKTQAAEIIRQKEKLMKRMSI